jgi:flavin reductase (DIM6/NTAB) family NADH-FMN oxidoreductase RutF
LPLLAGALCCLDCEVTEIADGGTHSIVIGVVRSVSVDRGAPLVYWERDFHSIGQTVGPATGRSRGCVSPAGSDD